MHVRTLCEGLLLQQHSTMQRMCLVMVKARPRFAVDCSGGGAGPCSSTVLARVAVGHLEKVAMESKRVGARGATAWRIWRIL